jgi:nucleotide sugar dehydrogenase
VDTPAAETGYDHGQVDRVIDRLVTLGPAPRRTELVVVSTTLPGYCDSKAAAAEDRGYPLSYNPGFVAQGSIMRDQQRPRQVLIGEADREAGDAIERMHRRVCTNQPAVHRLSRLGAEIAKLATNSFLTMKIAFANGIGDLATRAGADAEGILAAVGADTRIGTECLRYGFAYGGPCFPRDNRALDHFARRQGCELLQARATDEMNRAHATFQLAQYLQGHGEDEPIRFEGVAYKPGTEILDESPPLDLAVQLARAGRRVVLYDRPAVLARVRARFGDLFEYRDDG